MPTRQSLLLTAPKTLIWRTGDSSEPSTDEVLVRTLYGAVSIGTELPLYLGTSRGSMPTQYPKMTGYESYGVIEALGKDVEGFQLGDRVVSFYGHRTHALVPASRVIPIPRDLDPRLALLAILSCDVKKGIEKLQPRSDDTTLVTGAGAIGLLTVFVLRALGVRRVDVVEPVEARRKLAQYLGARAVFAASERTAREYQLGLECSSRNAAFELLQARLAQHGRICILADGNLESLTLTPQFHEKELLVVGSSDGLDYQGHATWFYGLEHLDRLKALFELEVSTQHVPQLFAEMVVGKQQPIKVLINYHQIEGITW